MRVKFSDFKIIKYYSAVESRTPKGRILSITFFLLASQLIFITPVSAATVTATGTHADTSKCNQTVSDATNVEVVRLSGGDCVLIFKSGSVTWTAPQGLTAVQILLVGGGAGGGGTFDTRGAGGGGAGQVNSNAEYSLSGNSDYSISVGAKGAGGLQPARANAPQNVGSNGGNSILSLNGSNLLVAYGGLGGCASRTTVYEVYCTSSTDSGTGGAAATTSSGGGRGGASGGGGGGSSGAGGVAVGGAGGAGTASAITGTSVTYGTGGNGGLNNTNAVGASASANTGNGGRGASSSGATNYNGGDGGSGIVVIRFSPDFVPSSPTFNSISGGDRRVTISFTAGSNNGAAITDYEYSLNGGSYTSAGTTTSPFTITGLSGRTAYSVTIKARNSVGLSVASSSLSATTTDASLDASETAAEAARIASAAAKQQKELTEILSLIPELGKISLSIGETSKILTGQKCVKKKQIKYVFKGKKCPKGFVKK